MRSVFLFLWICAAHIMWAQSGTDQRTTTTKIADLLAKMPSENARGHATNMEMVEALGERGITQLALMLQEPEENDNSPIEYALSGFSYFVSDGRHEAARRMAATAYVKALAKAESLHAKMFLINQIEVVGKDDIAGYLLTHLDDPQLFDPVIRALVKMNTQFTRKALLNALHKSKGELQLGLIEALGDTRSIEAIPAIKKLLNTSEKPLKKVVLYALSRIADTSYLDLLSREAEKAGYGFDITNATGAFLSYLGNLYDKGYLETVDKAALATWNNARSNQALKARHASLAMLTQTRGNKVVPLLIEAVNEKNRRYRIYVLDLALKFINNLEIQDWITLLTTVDPVTKSDLVEMLGKTGNITALPALVKCIDDKDPDVRLTAIRAASRLGGYEVQGLLLDRMKNADTMTLAVIKSCLLELKGSGVNVNEIAQALPLMQGKSLVTLIDVLSAKAATAHFDDVLAFIKSSDADVENAVFAALPSLSTSQTLPQLYKLMAETNDPVRIKNIQSAITSSLQGISDSTQRINNILSALDRAPEGRRYLYYDVLAELGDPWALKIVTNAFTKADPKTRLTIVNSLSNWKYMTASELFYQVVLEYQKHKDFNYVVNRYIEFIKRKSFTYEQRLLELRRIMEITSSHNKSILDEIGRCHTLPALLFAGRYLDSPADQQAAANAVTRIALSDEFDWNGKLVKTILEKTIQLLKGPDSEYQIKALRKLLDESKQDEGFVSMFNGKNLQGWKGLVENPIKRAVMTETEIQHAQLKADSVMRQGWEARDGLLIFKGKGQNLCTIKQYGDFEMYVDWKITKDGDAGIYLRGSPQVQVWDTSRVKVGAQVGSGGLYNNKIHPAKPLVMADNAVGAWNSFYIKMIGDKVTVFLNGQKVVDDVVLENYWDRNKPIFPFEQIELQAHGTYVAYRDLYIRELSTASKFLLSDEETKEGYQVLFDGTDLDAWQGNLTDYRIEKGELVVRPSAGSKHGNLYTKEEFDDFIYRLEFKLTPGANNGIGLRTPLTGDAAYEGLEVQMLDDTAPIYKQLKPFQYHGSVYGLIASKRGYLKPVGEWNYQEIKLRGNHITVTLNGTVIVDGDFAEVAKKGALDNLDHPGARRSRGHIAFLGHGEVVSIRNIRIRKL